MFSPVFERACRWHASAEGLMGAEEYPSAFRVWFTNKHLCRLRISTASSCRTMQLPKATLKITVRRKPKMLVIADKKQTRIIIMTESSLYEEFSRSICRS